VIPTARPIDPLPFTPPPPFDADADAGSFAPRSPFTPATSRFPPAPPGERPDPGPADDETVDRRADPFPPTDDPPTRVNRRAPRFDDLDAEWIPTDRLSLEADPPAPPTPPAPPDDDD
jgi:hypothetical protein